MLATALAAITRMSVNASMLLFVLSIFASYPTQHVNKNPLSGP